MKMTGIHGKCRGTPGEIVTANLLIRCFFTLANSLKAHQSTGLC